MMGNKSFAFGRFFVDKFQFHYSWNQENCVRRSHLPRNGATNVSLAPSCFYDPVGYTMRGML